MYNSQYYTCEQIDERLLQGYLDDYNTQTGQSLTKAQFLTKLGNIFSKEGVIDNIATQIGYYECDTAAGTAAKAITVANYALFAGGSMKVKFANKNTANNATLNINSQGAKALYYQGERASATNSWDAEEVVEIYYDGTSYYANNVRGGSGSGVYDVSVEHPTSGPNGDGKFTLEYILNSSNVNELIPVNKRYPGMSIKFVSTYNNKYVQYNYLGIATTGTPNPFLDTTNWQGVESVVIAQSKSIPNGGAVAEVANEIFEQANSALDLIGTERTIVLHPYNHAGIIWNGTSIASANNEYDGYILPLQNKCTYTFSNANSRGMYYADGHGYTQSVTSPYTANFAVDGFKYILFTVQKGSSLTVEKTVEQGIVKQLSDLITKETNHYNSTNKRINNFGNIVLGEVLTLGKETSIALTEEYYYGVIYDGSALVANSNSFNSFCVQVEKGCTYSISPNVTSIRFSTAKPIIGGSVGTGVSSFPYTATANGYLLITVSIANAPYTLEKSISGVYKEFNDYKNKEIGSAIKVRIPTSGTNAYINGQRQTITPQDLQGCAYTLVKVNVGETYRIYGKGSGEYTCLYTVRDSSYNVIQRKNTYNSRENGLDVTIEAGGEYLCVNFTDYSVDTDYVQQIYTHEESINNLRKSNHIDFADKTIVCFGDSITEFKRNGKGYCDYIADLTGANVINVGIGGTMIRQRQTYLTENPNTDGQCYACLDMVNLVTAVYNEDFSIQELAATWLKNNLSDDNTAIVARLEAIDWSSVDIVTIFGGTNDYGSYASAEPTCNIGTIDTPSKYTTQGALYQIVQMLLTKYPHLHLFIFTPLPRWMSNNSADWTDANWGGNKQNGEGKTLIDYVDAIKAQSESLGIPVCDMYRTIGWNKWNLHQYLLANGTDGTHPYRGFNNIANMVIAFLKSNWSLK